MTRDFRQFAIALLAVVATLAVGRVPTPMPPAPHCQIILDIAEFGVTMERAQALDKAGEHRQAERLGREAIDQSTTRLRIDSSQVATAAVFKQGRSRILSWRIETP